MLAPLSWQRLCRYRCYTKGVKESFFPAAFEVEELGLRLGKMCMALSVSMRHANQFDTYLSLCQVKCRRVWNLPDLLWSRQCPCRRQITALV